MAKKRSSGKRFRLLTYARMWQRWAWPCILIVLTSVVLWRLTPRIPIIHQPFRILTLVPALVALVLLVYTFLARRLAWVQCRPNHLRIQTPFCPLVVSYSRIKEVRPNAFNNIFDPTKEKEARQRWLLPYWGKTVVVVELSEYPVSKSWLRLWFNPYMLSPDLTGFVFLVEDWMTLSRQVDEFRNAWAMRRAERRQRASDRLY